MQHISSENVFVIRLMKGEELIDSLAKLCEGEDITAGFFTGIGATEHATLSFYDLERKEYQSHTLTTPHEIVSLSGNISLVKNTPFIHAHGIFSDENLVCKGGHVKDAVIGVTCEVYLTKLDTDIHRKHDNETGLSLLDCS